MFSVLFVPVYVLSLSTVHESPHVCFVPCFSTFSVIVLYQSCMCMFLFCICFRRHISCDQNVFDRIIMLTIIVLHHGMLV